MAVSSKKRSNHIVGIYLVAFREAKEITRKRLHYRQEALLPSHLIMACAAVSASFSAFITNPIDVLKLHYQVSRLRFSSLIFKCKPTSTTWELLSSLTKSHGPFVWLKGAPQRIMWIAPRTTITFTVYEFCRQIYKRA